MGCTFCRLYQLILRVESNQHYKAEKKNKNKKKCIIGAYPVINPGPLVQESDALTTRLRGQIVRLPN